MYSGWCHRIDLNEKEPELLSNISIWNEWVTDWMSCPSSSHIFSNRLYGWSLVLHFTCSESAQGLMFSWAGAWWFHLPCLNLIQPYLQRLEPNLSPPVTSNKNQAHPFLLLSQETQRQKGQHGHCFQIYVTGWQIMSCILRGETGLEFLQRFPNS